MAWFNVFRVCYKPTMHDVTCRRIMYYVHPKCPKTAFKNIFHVTSCETKVHKWWLQKCAKIDKVKTSMPTTTMLLKCAKKPPRLRHQVWVWCRWWRQRWRRWRRRDRWPPHRPHWCGAAPASHVRAWPPCPFGCWWRWWHDIHGVLLHERHLVLRLHLTLLLLLILLQGRVLLVDLLLRIALPMGLLVDLLLDLLLLMLLLGLALHLPLLGLALHLQMLFRQLALSWKQLQWAWVRLSAR